MKAHPYSSLVLSVFDYDGLMKFKENRDFITFFTVVKIAILWYNINAKDLMGDIYNEAW